MRAKCLFIMLFKAMIISLTKWMLTEILFRIMVAFLEPTLRLFLPEKVITDQNLKMFLKQVCVFASTCILEKWRTMETDMINDCIKHVKKSTDFCKKKNPDVPRCKTMVWEKHCKCTRKTIIISEWTTFCLPGWSTSKMTYWLSSEIETIHNWNYRFQSLYQACALIIVSNPIA